MFVCFVLFCFLCLFVVVFLLLFLFLFCFFVVVVVVCLFVVVVVFLFDSLTTSKDEKTETDFISDFHDETKYYHTVYRGQWYFWVLRKFVPQKKYIYFF